MEKAKYDLSIREKLVKNLKLYIWNKDEITGLNYFLKHKQHLPKWKDNGKQVVTLTRNYTQLETQKGVILRHYKLGDYFVCECMFRDTAIQIWLFDQDMKPVVNVTSYA